MKIATWNVNSVKARMPHVTAWLEVHKPDILMLQELKGLEFPTAEFKAMGYDSAAVCQKAYNGVAILARHKFTTELEALPGDSADEQARYLEITCGDVRIINIYAPNGNPVDTDKFAYKLAWLERLKERLSQLRREERTVVIGGDYNIIPEPKDCYDPKSWENDALFRLESRAKWRAIVNLGYTDAFRVFHTAPKEYTFWDYQAGAWPQNKGIRIDHFLLSPPAADRLKACGIDTHPRGLEKASDHTPVIMEMHA